MKERQKNGGREREGETWGKWFEGRQSQKREFTWVGAPPPPSLLGTLAETNLPLSELWDEHVYDSTVNIFTCVALSTGKRNSSIFHLI